MSKENEQAHEVNLYVQTILEGLQDMQGKLETIPGGRELADFIGEVKELINIQHTVITTLLELEGVNTPNPHLHTETLTIH